MPTWLVGLGRKETTVTTEPQFEGTIGRSFQDSQPWWPPPPVTADGETPNVVIILFDDMGFAHLGCYGSTIETPNIDALAEGGVRFSNFHTTALCSPTRASLADRSQPPLDWHARHRRLRQRATPTCAARSRATPPLWRRCFARRDTRRSRPESGTSRLARSDLLPDRSTPGRCSVASTTTTASCQAPRTSSIRN